MLKFPTRSVCAAALIATVCTSLTVDSAWAGPPRAKSPPAAKQGPVVLAIVVDQLAAWIVDERIGALPRGGGFARLVREGVRARDMRYRHSVTDTAPGHAALYTGATPRVNGIVGNEVPPIPACHGTPAPVPFSDRDTSLQDPSVKTVPSDGGKCGVSLAPLRVDTLADSLRAQRPDAIIVSLSFKDRGAVFGGGRHPTASLWFDSSMGRFVTSTAFADRVPVWITPVDAEVEKLVASRASWSPALPSWLAAHAGTADDTPGEGGAYGADKARGYEGLGRVFPHVVGSARALRATPFGDRVLRLGAIAALDGEGAIAAARQGRPVLLALSLSSNDAVGHVFGPDSWEAWDELYRLDDELAQLFSWMDRSFGERGWSALLAADHGVIHMPEACSHPSETGAIDPWRRPCKSDGRRLQQELPPPAATADPDAHSVETVEILQQVASRLPGGSRDWIRGIADPYVFLSDEARREPNLSALVRALEATPPPGVARVVVPSKIAGSTCADNETVDALVCNAIAPNAGGDLYLVPAPGSFFDPRYVRSRGSSHGTPYLYDRAVPLFVRAPGRVTPRLVDGPVPFSTFVRTAAALLGITPPATAEPAPDLLDAPSQRRQPR